MNTALIPLLILGAVALALLSAAEYALFESLVRQRLRNGNDILPMGSR